MEDRGTAVIDWRLQASKSDTVNVSIPTEALEYVCSVIEASATCGSASACCLPKHSDVHVCGDMQGRILGVLDVDAKIASTFRMNLLTGRVEQHR